MRRSAAGLLLVALLTIAAGPARADAPPASREGGFSLLPLPVLFYTPETKLGGGAALMILHRPEDRPDAFRPSTIALILIYTQKNQTKAGVEAELYLGKERWRIGLEGGFEDFPDLFYGLGRESRDEDEESFTQRSWETLAGVQRRLAPGLYLGPRVSLFDYDVSDLEEDSALREGALRGAGGGRTLSAGVTATWDRRNHAFLPDGGFLVDLEADFADRRRGSDFTYDHYAAEGRIYGPGLGEGHSSALQVFFEARSGGAPFLRLPGLGDEGILRGYHNRRFVDRNKVAFQGEYRLPLTDRWGAVLFAGAGDVVRNLEDLKAGRMRHGFGVGLRYAVKPAERLRIRLDFAFGAGESGTYVAFTEAF